MRDSVRPFTGLLAVVGSTLLAVLMIPQEYQAAGALFPAAAIMAVGLLLAALEDVAERFILGVPVFRLAGPRGAQAADGLFPACFQRLIDEWERACLFAAFFVVIARLLRLSTTIHHSTSNDYREIEKGA